VHADIQKIKTLNILYEKIKPEELNDSRSRYTDYQHNIADNEDLIYFKDKKDNKLGFGYSGYYTFGHLKCRF